MTFLCPGTPMYMAPEFFTGENPSYGRSIDVFAMGMLFLTMLQAEHGKPLLSPRTGRFNYVFSNFCWTYIWFKSSRTDTFYFIYQIWLQDTILNSSNPFVFSYLEDVSGAMSKFPIGMRMCMAHATHGPPIKLVEIKASDPPCIKQVKRLIPQMCESDPHKRPKAASLTDALGQCLGQ